MLHPASVFESPSQVTENSELPLSTKIKILRSWEYDAKEMMVATEENMTGNNSDMLDKVLIEINKLAREKGLEKSNSPTKQG